MCSLLSLLELKIIEAFVFLPLYLLVTIVESFIEIFSIRGCWNFQGAQFVKNVKSLIELCNMFIVSFIDKSFVDYIICCFKFIVEVLPL
jgi:hypothetical protein